MELSTEINIKQKLIDELELSQKKIHTLKSQYEDKLALLQHKIKDTEVERDHVLQSVKNQDAKADKVKEIRKEYEKKLSHFKSELKMLQATKKDHARLVRQKVKFQSMCLRRFTFTRVWQATGVNTTWVKGPDQTRAEPLNWGESSALLANK